jgi:hypothetical protein
MSPSLLRMLSDRDVDLLLEDLCVNGGYCVPPQVNAQLRNAPPGTPETFAETVVRAEGFDPALNPHEYRSVLKVVARAFRRSASSDL